MRDAVNQRLPAFVGTALFPNLAHALRWPARLGPRGLTIYVLLNAGLLCACAGGALPRIMDWSIRSQRAQAELRLELGREPTAAEVAERFAVTSVD